MTRTSAYVVRTEDGLVFLEDEDERGRFEGTLPYGHRLEYLDGIYDRDVTIRYMRVRDRREGE